MLVVIITNRQTGGVRREQYAGEEAYRRKWELEAQHAEQGSTRHRHVEIMPVPEDRDMYGNVKAQ